MTTIHTRICCRICQEELLVSDSVAGNDNFANITYAKFFKNKERRCNKCRTKPTPKGAKTLYIQADGTKKTKKDSKVKYGINADDFTADELIDNESQIKLLYETYNIDYKGDLDYAEFKNKVVENVIQGDLENVQF